MSVETSTQHERPRNISGTYINEYKRNMYHCNEPGTLPSFLMTPQHRSGQMSSLPIDRANERQLTQCVNSITSK